MPLYDVELPGGAKYTIEHDSPDLTQDQVMQVLARTLQSSTPRSQAAEMTAEMSNQNARNAGWASGSTQLAAGLAKFLPKSLAKYLPNANDADVAEGLQQGNGMARLGGIAADTAATFLPATKIYGGASQVLSKAPAIPELLRGLAAAGTAGGAVGAVVDPHSASQGAIDGALWGVAGEGLLRGLRRVAKGVIPASKEARALMDQDIQPTIGQGADKTSLAGRIVNSIETNVAKVPVLGSPVKNAQQRARGEWAEKVFDAAVPPGGVKPPNSAPPNVRVEDLLRQSRAGYDAALGGTSFKWSPSFDQGWRNEAANISSNYRMNPNEDRQMLSVLSDELFNRYPAHGARIPAADIKGLKSEAFQRSFHNDTPDRVVQGLRDLSTSADDFLHKNLPASKSAELRNLDKSRAVLERLRVATRRASGNHGAFSPAELAHITSTSGGASAVDDLALNGAKVLNMSNYEFGRGIPHGPGEAISMSAASSVLSPRAVNKFMLGGYEGQQKVAELLRKLSPAARLSFIEMSQNPGDPNAP